MVTLLKAIEDSVEKARSAGKLVAAKRYAATLRPLVPFLAKYAPEKGDLPLVEVLDFRFSSAFSEYLRKDYASETGLEDISDSTIERHLANIKAILRDNIKAGELPNLEIFPADAASEAVELKMLPHRVSEDFGRIVADFERNASICDHPEGVDAADLMFARIRARALGLLILSILCGGIGVDKLLSLSLEDVGDGTLRLPGSDIRMALPDAVENLLQRYLPVIECGGEVSEDKVRIAGKNIEVVCHSMGSEILKLYENPFASWLQFALEQGARVSDIRKTIALVVGKGGTTDESPEAFGRVSEAAAKTFRTNVKSWYAVKCLGMSGEDLASELDGFSPDELFAPKEMLARRRNSKTVYYNNPMLDKLLFFKGTASQARRIQRDIRAKGVIMGIRTAEGKVFSTIPEGQMTNFMRFLNAADESLVVFSPKKAYKGMRVRITGGTFFGCEGYIEDVRLGSGSETDPETGKPVKAKVVKCFVVVLDNFLGLGTLEYDARFVTEIKPRRKT